MKLIMKYNVGSALINRYNLEAAGRYVRINITIMFWLQVNTKKYIIISLFQVFMAIGLQVTDSYFYQTNTALYPVKSENSPTTADDRWLPRKQKVDWLL